MTDAPPKHEPAPTPDNEPDTEANAVHFVRSELFFVDCVRLPEGLKESDYPGFAELTLESLSPFPLRDLYYGAWVDTGSGSVLVYGALRRRVDPELGDAAKKVRFVLPEFLPACMAASAAGLSSLAFERIAEPQKADKDSSPADEPQWLHLSRSGEECPLLTPDLLAETSAETTAESGKTVLRLSGPFTFTENTGLKISFTAAGGSTADIPDAHLSTEALWLADIRDADFKATERTRRRRDALAMYGFAAAAIFALLLLLGQIGLLFFNRHVDNLVQKRDAQQAGVIAIQDQSDLLNTLEQIAGADLRPLDVLEAMNRVRMELAGGGTPGLHFTEIRAEPVNRMTVEGVASTVNDLTRYKDALVDGGRFVVINEPRTLVRGGRTTFTLTVDYIGEMPILSTAETGPTGN